LLLRPHSEDPESKHRSPQMPPSEDPESKPRSQPQEQQPRASSGDPEWRQNYPLRAP
jgi:hypothetical protein